MFNHVELNRLVLIGGAAARLTRLTTKDTITEPVRQWGHQRILFNREQRAAIAAGQPVPPPARPNAAQARTWLHTLVNCEWCASVWWAAALSVIERATLRRPFARAVFQLGATALTASYAVGWLAEHEQPAPPVQVSTAQPATFDPKDNE